MQREKSDLSWLRPDFMVIAHRGWSGSYPENTLLAVQKAMHLGCPMIEFDVLLSRDRKLLVFHDTNLERTSNGKGVFAERNCKELRLLDAGSWFHSKFKNTPIPSLEEILAHANSRVIYNIEIKLEAWEEEEHEDNVEYQIIDCVKKYKLEKQVLISCFQWEALQRIRKRAPELKRALLYRQDIKSIFPEFKTPFLYAQSLDSLKIESIKKEYLCYAIHPYYFELSHNFVKQCHRLGLRVFTFTANSYQEMEACLHANVDGIFTNHPQRLFQFIGAYKERMGKLATQEKEEKARVTE